MFKKFYEWLHGWLKKIWGFFPWKSADKQQRSGLYKTRKASREVAEIINREKDSQKKLFDEKIIILNREHKLIDLVAIVRGGFEEEFMLPDGQTVNYRIFNQLVSGASSRQECGEEVVIHDERLDTFDAPLNRWNIRLIDLGDSYYMYINYGGMAGWFWSESGISSYQDDSTVNEIFIQGCQLLNQIRALAQPIEKIKQSADPA